MEVSPNPLKLNLFLTIADWNDLEDDAFSKTGALTIKSSSSSSGGLVGALGKPHNTSLEITGGFCQGIPCDTCSLIFIRP